MLSFECNFCNICWVPTAKRVNGKARYLSDIMLVCNQFKRSEEQSGQLIGVKEVDTTGGVRDEEVDS